MAIWTVTPVEQEPSTTLVGWQVLELPDGDRHLVGRAVEAQEGRVCSAVQSFDVARLRAVTRSGRVYQLKGRPGVDAQAAYVWERWLAIHREPSAVDVTDSVWTEHIRAARAQETQVALTTGRGVDHG
jgi:hypothetical protein